MLGSEGDGPSVEIDAAVDELFGPGIEGSRASDARPRCSRTAGASPAGPERVSPDAE